MQNLADPDCKPAGSPTALPVWWEGRWRFVPWVPGIGPCQNWQQSLKMAEFEAKCQTTIYFNKGNTTETSKPVMMKDTTNERLGGNVVVFGNPKKTRFVVGTKDKLLIDQVFKD